jgi:hypothetical protein
MSPHYGERGLTGLPPCYLLQRRSFHKMSEREVINNQKHILKNQKAILSNQSQIKANQETIKKNQASILKNQNTLNTVVRNQEQILTLLKK